jgi:7,8-dihydropterin-6-yl-methyl-4-(beta-D-ribofuranosyl)aminobenzene 5'-phosphate synthase
MRMKNYVLCVFTILALGPAFCNAQSPNQITVLYDAFGKSPALKKDWGYSALIEYGGKRILFDTGNSAGILAKNVKALQVDLNKLDCVVISHRHGDHIGGLDYLLAVNPNVKIYVPRETWGVFGGPINIGDFYRRSDSLPAEQRYFDGTPPQTIPSSTPWPLAQFVQVDHLTEIAPGIYLVPTISQVPGTLELHELSLSLRTPKGQVLLVGCSHPGIERILEAARTIDNHVYLIAGGLHLVNAPDVELQRIAHELRDKWNVNRIAPGHCTGEPAFATLQDIFGTQYSYAGLGTTIKLP